MEPPLLQKLADKTINKATLSKMVAANFNLLPEVFNGITSTKATVRYGCASVLVELTSKYPDRLYPYFDEFVFLLDSKHRILTWNALAAIANLCCVDKEKKFDEAFDKYFSFLDNEYLVTVANVVGNAGKIAQAKTYLIPKVTEKLLRIEGLPTNPHLTEECKRVLAGTTIDSFNEFFAKLDAKDKPKVLAFTSRCLDSPRTSLKAKAEQFLKRWSRV